MADSVLFDVDAGQILAKLHLAARDSVKKVKDAFFVNSGIKNDSQSTTPENPGKVVFDLANNTNEYEVGYITTIKYHKAYGLDDLVDAVVDTLAKTSGDSSKITDDIKSKNEDYKKLDASKQQLSSIFNSYGIKLQDKDMSSIDSTKNLKALAKEAAKKDEEEYNKMMTDIKKEAVDKLYGYLKTFAGVENVKKFSEQDIGMLYIADDINAADDNRLVKNFVLQEMSKQDKDKLVAQFRANFEKDPKQDNCEQKVCFKVKYTLNVDK